jgi:hypothetical protein
MRDQAVIDRHISFAWVFAGVVAAAGCQNSAAPASAASAPAIRFEVPSEGQQLGSGFEAALAVTGFTLDPAIASRDSLPASSTAEGGAVAIAAEPARGRGHIHLSLDGGHAIEAADSYVPLLDLAPGRHRLAAQLVDNQHHPLPGADSRAEVSFVVDDALAVPLQVVAPAEHEQIGSAFTARMRIPPWVVIDRERYGSGFVPGHYVAAFKLDRGEYDDAAHSNAAALAGELGLGRASVPVTDEVRYHDIPPGPHVLEIWLYRTDKERSPHTGTRVFEVKSTVTPPSTHGSIR